MEVDGSLEAARHLKELSGLRSSEKAEQGPHGPLDAACHLIELPGGRLSEETEQDLER